MHPLIVLNDAVVVSILSSIFIGCTTVMVKLLLYIWNERKERLDTERKENLAFQTKLTVFCAEQTKINEYFEEKIERLEEEQRKNGKR